MKKTLLTIFTALAAISLFASNDWLTIYHKEGKNTKVISSPLTEIDSVYYTCSDTLNPEIFSVLNMQSKLTGLQRAEIQQIDSMVIGTNIPLLYIDTDPYVDEITSKIDYTKASLRYIPYSDGTDTLYADVNIRGRGNTTWTYPKKPYRLKFDKKQSLGGLKKAKSFVLLANFLDNTMIKDAVGFKIAELIGMPYANHAVPVNLVFNGKYRGSYIITEKTGINAGSVDIDETTGVMWELDTYFDEEFQFRSTDYDLPCLLKDPDLYEIADNDPEKVDSLWNMWKEDLDKAISNASSSHWQEYFDKDQMVKYVLVNNLIGNHEISHPKSVKLYKEKIGETYKMGPVWDLDWTIGFKQTTDSPFIHRISQAYSFFVPIFFSASFREAYGKELNDFKENHLQELLDYIDELAAKVRVSAFMDADVWHYETWDKEQEINKAYFDYNILNLKNWLIDRIECMSASYNYLLY